MKSWRLTLATLTTAAAVVAGCGTMQAKPATSGERGAAIAAKLAEADRMGAGDCAPRALAAAYVALEHAMHEYDEAYYPDGWLKPRFDAAEKLADDLLAERKLVASLGRTFHCAAPSRRNRAATSRSDTGDVLASPEESLTP